MSTNVFAKSVATVGAWNLSTYERLDDDRIRRQAKGLGLLDAEFITLVEIKDEAHLQSLARHLTDDGVEYGYTFIAQAKSRRHSQSLIDNPSTVRSVCQRG